MSIHTNYLEQAMQDGFSQIGQVQFSLNESGHYLIYHQSDSLLDIESLSLLVDEEALQNITVWGTDGEYRFLKGSTTLKAGWYYVADNLPSLVSALQVIYPACISLLVAHDNQTIRSQSLSGKLSRQTGMYGRTKNISAQGATKLITDACKAPSCDKVCLWTYDTELKQMPSSSSSSTPPKLPLICQEPCNHLVASCRPIVKQEWEASQAAQA